MSCGSATKMSLWVFAPASCMSLLALRICYSSIALHRTQFSHLSQWQLSTALLNTPRSPQYRTTHHTTTSAFASVKSRRRLQFELRSAFLLSCTAGRIRYKKKALASLHAWYVKLSGPEYAPTGTPYSSYVVIVCWKRKKITGAAFWGSKGGVRRRLDPGSHLVGDLF